MVGRVRGGDAAGRTRVIVAGDAGEKDTSILLPEDQIVEVVER